MRDLARLNQHLDSNFGDGLAEAFRGSLESGKATAFAALQFGSERRKRGSVEHCGERLGVPIDNGNRHGAASDSRVMEQILDESRRQERQIDGEKDYETRGCGLQRRANTSQRTQPRLRISKDGRISGKIRLGGRAGSRDHSRNASLVQRG